MKQACRRTKHAKSEPLGLGLVVHNEPMCIVHLCPQMSDGVGSGNGALALRSSERSIPLPGRAGALSVSANGAARVGLKLFAI